MANELELSATEIKLAVILEIHGSWARIRVVVREQTVVGVSMRIDRGRNLASNNAEMKVFLNRSEDGRSMF